MKRYALAVLLACTFAVPLSHAAEAEDHAGHHPVTDAGDEESAAPKQDKMHARMKKMHEQMEKIQASTDPKERQKLLDEHMASMREGMKAMRGMGKKPKAECPPADDDTGGMMGGMMMKKHKSMESRLDAMQKMMEQMLEHEAAEQDVQHGK